MSPVTRELLRKLIHLMQLPIIGGYTLIYFYFSPQIGILSLTAVLLLLLEFEYFRIDYHTKLGSQITAFFSKTILRKHERNNVTGAIFFIISAIIAFSAFQYEIALLALLMTVFGDLTSGILGTTFGKKKIFRNKSYVGTTSGLLINIFMGLIIMPMEPQIFLPMAFTASIVETLTQKLDDNLTVPLFAGFTGQLIVFLLQL